MPFTPPPHISQGSYTPYSSLARPPVGTVLYDQVYNDDLLSIKVHLRSMLKMNRLSNMPMGFPFHSVYDGHGRSQISHESYEFHEQFCFSDQRSRPQTATFSYTAPSSNPNAQEQRMSWQITIPSRESSLNGNIPSKISIARVDVDRLVFETSYGLELMTNPRIILEALSLSIELGILITVIVANRRTPMLYPTVQNSHYVPGDILFIATDNNNMSEVVFVPRTEA